jgi:hypothetical protein
MSANDILKVIAKFWVEDPEVVQDVFNQVFDDAFYGNRELDITCGIRDAIQIIIEDIDAENEVITWLNSGSTDPIVLLEHDDQPEKRDGRTKIIFIQHDQGKLKSSTFKLLGEQDQVDKLREVLKQLLESSESSDSEAASEPSVSTLFLASLLFGIVFTGFMTVLQTVKDVIV